MESQKIFSFAIILVIGIIIGIVGFMIYSGLTNHNPDNTQVTGTGNTQTSQSSQNTESLSLDKTSVKQNLKQFATYEDFKNYLKKTTTTSSNSQGSSAGGGSMMLESAVNSVSAKASADVAAPSAAPAADYSHTNVQVEGVDEPDIMKNDGNYIYTLSGNNIKIVQAYPASDMKVLGEIKYENHIIDYNKPYTTKYARNFFLNGNKLVVFLTESSYTPYSSIRCLGLYYCGGDSETYSDIYVYDVSDKSSPKIVENISVKGDYNDARMIKDYVYLVSKQYANPDEPEMPYYYYNGVLKEIGLDSIYYFGYTDDSYYLTSVSSLNVKTGDFNSQAYLTGYTSELYASENNLYITSMEYMDNDVYQKILIQKAVEPIVGSEEKQQIEDILNSNKYEYSKWRKIGIIVENYYNKMSESDKENFNKTLFDNLYNEKVNLESEREKTVVHKISIDKDKVEYKTSAKVPGHLLNQFSMDESNGYFRIATTVGQQWWWGWSNMGRQFNSSNGLYVLDSNMNLVGHVDGLASGETIYSTRFIGNRAYLVTYRTVDPMFVIDLTEPTNPKVLGYLKVNGVSNYLHPYDENHIIGFGTDATSDGRQKGMKISLFDVTDINNPKEQATYLIGDRGTNSPILYDHKSLLFDKDKHLMVIPVLVYEINPDKYKDSEGGIPSWAYGEQTYQGAYVFNIDTNGITLKGKITHFSPYVPAYGAAKDAPIGTVRFDYYESYTKTADDKWKPNRYFNGYYYSDDRVDEFPGGTKFQVNFYDSRYTIQRSLFMDNILYTVSNSQIKANDLSTLSDINSVDLSYVDDYQRNYYY